MGMENLPCLRLEDILKLKLGGYVAESFRGKYLRISALPHLFNDICRLTKWKGLPVEMVEVVRKCSWVK